MNNKITVKEKNVYGKVLIYPVCDQAKLFCQLLGTKTFHNVNLAIIESLGYKITVIPL